MSASKPDYAWVDEDLRKYSDADLDQTIEHAEHPEKIGGQRTPWSDFVLARAKAEKQRREA